MHGGRDVDVDTADAVNESGEAGEVDIDDKRDVDAEEAADVIGLRSWTVRVADVDLLTLPAGIARDIDHGGLVKRGVDAEHVQGVATRAADARA